MSAESEVVGRILEKSLSGEGAHVETRAIFAGLDWKIAGNRPDGAPRSVFQLLKHMAFWQDWVLKWLDGKNPPIPKHASGSWEKTPAPVSEEEWKYAVEDFRRRLNDLEHRSRRSDLLTKRGQKSSLEMLHTIASHNSYHAGQVVVLRQILGKWPPPSGGLTW